MSYMVFDIESIADKELIAKARRESDTDLAVEKYRKELMERKGSDFIPYTMQIPVSLVVGLVDDRYRWREQEVLKFEDGGPEYIAKKFWDMWVDCGTPTFVTFNGRGFDIPLMEMMAFRYGISLPAWYALGAKSWAQPRGRYNHEWHLDLYDFLTNYGAIPFSGGLNLAAKALGMPGKMETEGCMVQCLFDAGRLEEIHSYCRCDVLDTYFVFLRIMTLCGKINNEEEQIRRDEVMGWLNSMKTEIPVFVEYLERMETE